MEREQLRTTFNEDAALYDRARPDYPAELIDDVSKLADIGPGSRVLEIGAGTGKATVALAERGGEIIAVELGADMVAVAQRNLARFRNVRWVESSFEDQTSPEPY